MIQQSHIKEALNALIGLPIWDTLRALDMQMFDIGRRRRIIGGNGKPIQVGRYSLHIQSPWRIVDKHGIITGQNDRFYADNESPLYNDDEPARLEARIRKWLKRHQHEPVTIEAVSTDSTGAFKLKLSKGYRLEVFPAHSKRGEYSEHWRLMGWPDINDHFVVTGYGIEGRDNPQQME